MGDKASYLGDGCYVDFDGYGLVLTISNGIEITNRIVLEPDVYKALTEYVSRLGEPKSEPKEDDAAIDAGQSIQDESTES